MALTDTFVRFAKASKPSGDKHCDGCGLYIHVKPQGKYWRLDYRYINKRKTMALGTYPEVALVKARKRRDDARVLLADGIDPAEARREEREAKLIAANTADRYLLRRQSSAHADAGIGRAYIGVNCGIELFPFYIFSVLRSVLFDALLQYVLYLKSVCEIRFRQATRTTANPLLLMEEAGLLLSPRRLMNVHEVPTFGND